MVKIYRNEDVVEIIAAIPNGHYHVRFLVRFKDQEILLQEATVAAIVRAYVLTALHPIRRGIILRRRVLGKESRKKGFASAQLIEEHGSEEEAVSYITKIMGEHVS